MMHNGEFCQKRGLDWLKMANFGHFACFPIFSPKMRLRLTQSGQFHLIHNFSYLLPPKCLIFGEISKIFVLGGGSSLANFLFELFPTKVVQNDPQWPILSLKWLDLAWNRQFWLNFNKNLNISAESWPICTKPSEQGLFFPAGQNESKEYYAMIKTDENLNITSDDEPSHLSNESCQKCNKMIWQPLFSHFWQFL